VVLLPLPLPLPLLTEALNLEAESCAAFVTSLEYIVQMFLLL